MILPTKPAMPRHKGKVEAGVKYVQENGLAGRTFESLGAQNLHLAHWEQTVADTRIHGTTRQQVGKHFMDLEKPKLLPLPAGLFPCFNEAPRKVHRDGYAEVDKAYYSVPPEYMQRRVWARWDAKIVRLFNERMEIIAVHVRQEPGKFHTDPAHIHSHKRTLIEHGADWMLDRCRLLGAGAGTWAETLYQQRGAECLRVLQGLLALAEIHPVGHRTDSDPKMQRNFLLGLPLTCNSYSVHISLPRAQYPSPGGQLGAVWPARAPALIA